MVGAVRFELTTSCTPSKRATKLRYAPSHCVDSSLPTAGFNHENCLEFRPVHLDTCTERK